jgi:stage V sporulation protein G
MTTKNLLVTQVDIYFARNKPEGSFVEAFAKIVINDELLINGIKVVRGRKGLFIGFPQEFDKKEGRGYDICFPVSLELRQHISDAVLNQFKLQCEISNV